MSGRHSGSEAESGSVGSSRGSSWQERRQKRREDRDHKREDQSGLGERSYQTQRTISSASGHRQFDERDEKIERLRQLVRDLELEAEDKRRGRNRGD